MQLFTIYKATTMVKREASLLYYSGRVPRHFYVLQYDFDINREAPIIDHCTGRAPRNFLQLAIRQRDQQ